MENLIFTQRQTHIMKLMNADVCTVRPDPMAKNYKILYIGFQRVCCISCARADGFWRLHCGQRSLAVPHESAATRGCIGAKGAWQTSEKFGRLTSEKLAGLTSEKFGFDF